MRVDADAFPFDVSWATEFVASDHGLLSADVAVRLEHDPDASEESASIHRNGSGYTVVASDAAGAQYGLLELEERLNLGTEPKSTGDEPVRISPRFPFRAFKFNLPWYSYRWGEVMTQHEETCRSRTFWLRLLDHLARCRFNALSLWALLPFPFMVRVRSFPEAAMGPESEMDEWEDLWRFVFGEARRRNIRPIVIWWTIFVPRHLEDAWGIDMSAGEYHFGPGQTDERVERYNRAATTALIDAYDDLAGVGVCMGERMENLSPSEQRAWIERTVYKGVRDASRPVLFVQRASLKADAHSVRDMVEKADLPGPVVVEYKFNWSHAHSTPHLAMTHNSADEVDTGLWSPEPSVYKMAWMARNEDVFVLRWGDPEFIRAHIARNGHAWVAGYFTGCEGQIPALERAERLPAAERGWDFAFERQWLFGHLWGRLLYDPATRDEQLALQFEARYGTGIGGTMLRAFALASRMPLRLASFHAGTWDYTLYSEGFLAPFPSSGLHDGRPFISVDELIDHPTLDPNLMSIREYVVGDDPAGRTTPDDLAAELASDSRELRRLTDQLRLHKAPLAAANAYQSECDDLETWTALTDYFAAKLRGAVHLARLRAGGLEQDREQAVKELERAADHWRRLVGITSRRYKRIPYIERSADNYRLDFHWADYSEDVKQDVETARSAPAGGSKHR